MQSAKQLDITHCQLVSDISAVATFTHNGNTWWYEYFRKIVNGQYRSTCYSPRDYLHVTLNIEPVYKGLKSWACSYFARSMSMLLYWRQQNYYFLNLTRGKEDPTNWSVHLFCGASLFTNWNRCHKLKSSAEYYRKINRNCGLNWKSPWHFGLN